MRHPDFALAGGMPPMAGTGTATGTGGSQPNPSPLKSVDRVRSVFPETWLWSNASIGFVNIINKHNHKSRMPYALSFANNVYAHQCYVAFDLFIPFKINRTYHKAKTKK